MEYTVLSKCGTIINGYAFKSKNYVGNGYRVIRIANVQDGFICDEAPCFYPMNSDENIAGYVLRENDILISLTGNVGRIGIMQSALLPAVLNQRVCCVRVNQDFFCKYLYYFLRRNEFRTDCVKASNGMAQLNLSSKWLANYPIPICNYGEQQHIVARIEELFSQLDDAEATLQKTKAQLAVYRQAVYASAYQGMAPDRSIMEFFDITGGITKNSTRSTMPIKRPYLRVANVYYNRLDLTEIKEIGVTNTEIEKCTLEKNDLLFVEGNGSKSQIGRVAIWDGSIPNIVHQNHIIKGRPNGKMLPEFALFYLISAEGRKQVTEVAKSTSGLYTLSTEKVRKLKVPYCSQAEQAQRVSDIYSRLSICENIEQAMTKTIQQNQALRMSILKQAFGGPYD